MRNLTIEETESVSGGFGICLGLDLEIFCGKRKEEDSCEKPRECDGENGGNPPKHRG
jgi:hypothetical protein